MGSSRRDARPSAASGPVPSEAPHAELERLRARVAELERAEEERARARLELLQPQEMLRLVMDNIPQSLFWKDRDSRYLGCNRQFASSAGLDAAEEIVGRTDGDFPWRERAETYREQDRGVMESNRTLVLEQETYTRPDGERRWLRTVKVPLHDPAGEVVGLLGLDEDITSRMREVEAIRSIVNVSFTTAGEDFFRSLTRHLAEALGVRYAFVSELTAPGSARTLAFWAGDAPAGPIEYALEGSPCDTVINGTFREYPEGVREKFPAFSLLTELEAESYVGSALFDSSGEPVGLIGVMDTRALDDLQTVRSILTIFAARAGAELERMRSDQARLQSQERYRSLFEDAPISLWDLDLSAMKSRLDALRADGVRDFRSYFSNEPLELDRCLATLEVVDVNQATVELFSAGSKKQLLEDGERTVPGKDRGILLEALMGVAEGRRAFEVEGAMRTFEGERLVTTAKIFVTPGSETTLARVILAITDITARKRMERVLREAQLTLEVRVQERTADLATAHEDLKSLLYIVSHDLRAPLVNLKGFSGELLSACDEVREVITGLGAALPGADRERLRVALDEDVPEALDFIDTSVNRIDHFMNTLLKLSLEGRRELYMERVDVAEVVDESLKILAYRVEQARAEVVVGSLPTVVADRISIEQILTNLLSNAVLYLDPKRPGRIEISGERTEEHVLYRVADNGRGIASEDLGKVFLPFRRGRHMEIEGEGMGLAYVQALVRRHGGRIWCDSELGAGTTFTFTISGDLIENDPRTGVAIMTPRDARRI